MSLPPFTHLQGFWTGSFSFSSLVNAGNRHADVQTDGGGEHWLCTQGTEVPFLNPRVPHPTFHSPTSPVTTVTISVFRPQVPDQDDFQTVWASVSPSPAGSLPHPHTLYAKVSISSRAQCMKRKVISRTCLFTVALPGHHLPPFQDQKWMEG